MQLGRFGNRNPLWITVPVNGCGNVRTHRLQILECPIASGVVARMELANRKHRIHPRLPVSFLSFEIKAFMFYLSLSLSLFFLLHSYFLHFFARFRKKRIVRGRRAKCSVTLSSWILFCCEKEPGFSFSSFFSLPYDVMKNQSSTRRPIKLSDYIINVIVMREEGKANVRAIANFFRTNAVFAWEYI